MSGPGQVSQVSQSDHLALYSPALACTRLHSPNRTRQVYSPTPFNIAGIDVLYPYTVPSPAGRQGGGATMMGQKWAERELEIASVDLSFIPSFPRERVIGSFCSG